MEDRERETFGGLLRRLRAARGWTQEELAERANVSAQAVSTLERGTRRLPWPTTVARLADALNLSAEERDRFSAIARVYDAAPGHAAQSRVLEFVAPAPPTNLPDDVTRFIGRAPDIEAVTRLLQDPSIRLVTLTGPGGIGKTRLAIEVGRSLLQDYRHGVYFVSLASLADPRLVPSAVARALEVPEHGNTDSLEALARHVRGKRLLLILDNFEHLLEASTFVADLLDTTRDLHILVTSRFLLHLSREQEYRVAPLTFPDRDSPTALNELGGYESIALFLDRARRARPDFELTPENAHAVAEICARLDGLPLAIELGAARARLFPPRALLSRLDSRLALLTGGPRDRHARQQTVRATIDWSYALLSEEEQRLFARLGVFAGGCTYEAAEVICGEDGCLNLLGSMTSLVEKSLVQQSGEDEARFTMLETIREYAVERLEASGEAESLRRRHAEYFLRKACDAQQDSFSPQQSPWAHRFETEHDNLRAALDWCLTRSETTLGLRIAVNINWFWYARGRYAREGQRWLEQLLAGAGTIDESLRSVALQCISWLTVHTGDFQRGEAAAAESLAIFRRTGDLSGTALSLFLIALHCWKQRRTVQARSLVEESVRLSRSANDKAALGICLQGAALTALHDGEEREGVRRLRECESIWREMGEERNLAFPLRYLAAVACDAGDTKQARQFLQEVLSADPTTGDFLEVSNSVDELGYVAVVEGDPHRAVRLWGATDALRDAIGCFRDWHDRERYERYAARARARMSDGEWCVATEQGRSMTIEQAIAHGLDARE